MLSTSELFSEFGFSQVRLPVVDESVKKSKEILIELLSRYHQQLDSFGYTPLLAQGLKLSISLELLGNRNTIIFPVFEPSDNLLALLREHHAEVIEPLPKEVIKSYIDGFKLDTNALLSILQLLVGEM